MAQLRQTYQEFVKRETQVIIVGPENAKAFEAYFSKHDLPFIGLPDPKGSVLKRYGQEVNLFKLGRMPAQVIVDQAGVVRFVHYGNSMADIPESTEVLSLIDQLEESTKFTDRKGLIQSPLPAYNEKKRALWESPRQGR
jgi:peroxiredoxin